MLGRLMILRTVAVKRICKAYYEDHYTRTLLIIATHSLQNLRDGNSEQTLKALCCKHLILIVFILYFPLRCINYRIVITCHEHN